MKHLNVTVKAETELKDDNSTDKEENSSVKDENLTVKEEIPS